MGKEYRKAVTGSSVQPAGMQFQAGAPLDDRMVVNNKESLIHQCLADGTGGVQWLYNGQITCDKETGDIYVLMDKSKLTLLSTDDLDKLSPTEIDDAIKAAWTKIPSQTDLETNKKDLFSFQGVASAIDADHCTLTIGPASRGTTTPGYSFSVSDYKVDIEGDTYFYWSSTAKGAPTGVWTRGDFANGTKTYTKSQFTANIFVYGGETYYETGETAIVQNVERTKYLTLDGDILWVDTDNYIYETSASTTKVQTDAVTLDSDSEVVFFTEDKTTLSDVLNSGKAEKATNGNGSDIKSNKGHVYQLGEEEYASNGTIWVQLGSPKEDWIVIK